MHRSGALVALFLMVGCPADTEAPAAGGSETGTGAITTLDAATDDGGSADGASSGGGSGGATATDGAAESDGADSDSGANDPVNPLDCNGTIYECGDGKDNDGDGKIDLFDPECTGPCDDDESSFQTGIPGDNMDCKQDCFFDGNSGQGDDGCIWNLKCDPENPGANVNCEYTGGMNCENMPPNQDADCLAFCIPLVPPGCDCFGCCLLTDSEGNEISIFLNSHPDCALDNLDACEPCTQSEDCVNTCEDCELCFGADTLPEGCDDNECSFGDPCQANADCPSDWFCLQQCCYPPPEG